MRVCIIACEYQPKCTECAYIIQDAQVLLTYVITTSQLRLIIGTNYKSLCSVSILLFQSKKNVSLWCILHVELIADS